MVSYIDSSEQKDAGSESVIDASAASSTSTAFVNTEEVVADNNSDMTPCLPGTRRKKSTVITAGSVDRRKTSAAKKPKSSKFTHVDEESSNESETVSGDSTTPQVVMGRPSPIMLRSLAKLGKGKRDTSVLEVPDALEL